MGKLKGYLRLMRPINCLMMGFAVIVGAALANSKVIGNYWPNLVYGFLTGFLLTAASMVINDYYDREIDAINEPGRPIPSGLIKPKEALTFAILLTVLGLTASLLTSAKAITLCFATALAFWLVSASYVTVGKRTGLWGNLLVSVCVSAPFIYGSLAVANEVKGNIWIFVSMVFLSNTGREITKGIVDVEGDRARKVRTVAVRHGERTAALAASALYILAVMLTPLPPLLNMVSVWFIPLVAITDMGLVASSMKLSRDYSRENARKIKNQVLAWFLIGLIAFLVGSLN
ncbi:MAG: geranylgeranylglycerol-phosphate geranylgeranyltransferase [Candidatus Bathycorpusculaceae bacterium]